MGSPSIAWKLVLCGAIGSVGCLLGSLSGLPPTSR